MTERLDCDDMSDDLPNGVLLIDGMGGPVVAWFAKMDDAEAFSEEYYFGRRLFWGQCKPPELIPLSEEQMEVVRKRALEIAAFITGTT
jgi:hypothetical protein